MQPYQSTMPFPSKQDNLNIRCKVVAFGQGSFPRNMAISFDELLGIYALSNYHRIQNILLSQPLLNRYLTMHTHIKFNIVLIRMKKLGKLIKEADQFSIPITLTYHGQKDFKSITSGLVSLIVIFFFSYIFVIQFISMINHSVVKSKTQEFKQTEAPVYSLNQSNFMFSLLIMGVDLTSAPRYFDISVLASSYKQGVGNSTAINMERCTREHWAKLGDQTENFFQLYNMWNCLCPPLDFNFDLKGKYTMSEFKMLQIHIRKCIGVVGVDCRSSAEIDAYLASRNYQFTLGIEYMETLVDPTKENPFTYYINDDFYWGFSITQGMQVLMQVRTQTINTDNSLLPNEDISTIVSPVIEPAQIGSFDIVNSNVQDYVTVSLMQSATGVRITRSFYKFDELLAYLGGLFGLIALIVDLPLRAYNQMCHDVGLSHYLFDYESEPIQGKAILSSEQELVDRKKGFDDSRVATSSLQAIVPIDGGQSTSASDSVQVQPHSSKKFNFLIFTLVSVYKIFKKCDPKKKCASKRLDPYVHSLEEVQQEMDIRSILKKLMILERAVKCLMPAKLYSLVPYFKQESLHHSHGLNKSLKHYRHIVNLKFDEEDQQSTQDLQKLVGEALQSNDELSKQVLKEIDEKVLKICGPAAKSSGTNLAGIEGSQPLIVFPDTTHQNVRPVAERSFEYLN